MAETRIKSLDMTMADIVVALAEGNPGAVRAMAEICAVKPQVDPDSCLGWLGPLSMLDTLKIYGPRIWVLFKDLCNEDPVKMVAVLRAVQLGLLHRRTLDRAIDATPRGTGSLDLDDIIAKVRKRLPSFSPEANAA